MIWISRCIRVKKRGEMRMKKIMVVDDDVYHVQTVKQILEGADDPYEVICAGSGIDCLNLLRKIELKNEEIPDLILLDIMMPKMSGWETFKKLKENSTWENIPVIFFSGRTDEFAEKAGSFLAVDYIKKPYDVEDLKKKIDKILEKSNPENL